MTQSNEDDRSPQQRLPAFPRSVDQVRQRLEWGSKISLGAQAGLGLTASLSWMFVLFGRLFNRIGYAEGAGTVLAFWTVIFSLVTLGVTIYLTWVSQKVARRLRADPAAAVVGVLNHLQLLIYVSLIGILLSIVSSAAQVGELLSSSLFSRFSVRLEIPGLLLAIASTNITLAHFTNLSFILWVYGLLDRNRKA